ncbi:MAG: FAD-dependent oxidoreductase [Acidobacteria bacterium]|nr:FAD-dependent oxidoreductase [Acidobacteriota bacterium]
MLERRAFLGGLVAATAFAAPSNRRVLIAGAGIAGLACAHELTKRGYDVTIFEGRARPGGRIETLREGLGPGMTAETGATRIPDTHHFTLAYVNEFGLPLEPFHAPVGLDLFHIRGKSFTIANGKEPDWPLDLRPEERKLGRNGLAKTYLLPPVEAARPFARSLQVPPPIAAADRVTLGEYLSGQGLSPDAVELATLGVSPTIAAGHLLLVESSSEIRNTYFHIRGGNDLLPFALARRLAGKIQYGCRVAAFTQDGTQASITIERAGERETHRAPHIVCTLPFSVTAGLFDGAHLSRQKQTLTETLLYGHMTKVFLQMREQFWRKQGLSGFAFTDLLSERFWALGPAQAAARGLLLSYMIGPKAERLGAMPETERVRATLADAETLFPGARSYFEGATVKNWKEDKWQNGGTVRLPPGRLNALAECAVPEGRIHFAGEHTSRWTGWIQGSIESAHRVVREISTSTL